MFLDGCSYQVSWSSSISRLCAFSFTKAYIACDVFVNKVDRITLDIQNCMIVFKFPFYLQLWWYVTDSLFDYRDVSQLTMHVTVFLHFNVFHVFQVRMTEWNISLQKDWRWERWERNQTTSHFKHAVAIKLVIIGFVFFFLLQDFNSDDKDDKKKDKKKKKKKDKKKKKKKKKVCQIQQLIQH